MTNYLKNNRSNFKNYGVVPAQSPVNIDVSKFVQNQTSNHQGALYQSISALAAERAYEMFGDINSPHFNPAYHAPTVAGQLQIDMDNFAKFEKRFPLRTTMPNSPQIKPLPAAAARFLAPDYQGPEKWTTTPEDGSARAAALLPDREPVEPPTLSTDNWDPRARFIYDQFINPKTRSFKHEQPRDYMSEHHQFISDYQNLNHGQTPVINAPGPALVQTGPYAGLPNMGAQEAQQRQAEITRLQGSNNYQDKQRLAQLELRGYRNELNPLTHAWNGITRPWSQNRTDVAAGVGLNHAANNQVDTSRMNRLNFYQNHDYTKSLNQFPHSNLNQFNAMHDYYSGDPQRQQNMINRATTVNLGEEERVWADTRNKDMGLNRPLSPDYTDNPILNAPGFVSGFLADTAFDIPTFAGTGRTTGSNRTAMNTAKELMNKGYGWVDASAIARDIERRNAWNYMDVAGINPASAGRKALMRRYGNSPIVKNTVDAFNRSKVGSKLDELSNVITPAQKRHLTDLSLEAFDRTANQAIKNKYADVSRRLVGLPPELRDEAYMELITNSALGVIDDRFTKKYRGY